MPKPLTILTFAGSLRKNSYNKALIKVAQEVAPKNVQLEVFDLAPLPFFNEDVEAQGLPEAVQEFRDKIAAADALLIAVPEYNNFIPGVLKNALEWASRTIDGQAPLVEKPVGIMSASTSGYGGVRAHVQMKAMALPLHIHLLDNFGVTVSNAHQKFGPQGELLDERIREKVKQLVDDLVSWTLRLQA